MLHVIDFADAEVLIEMVEGVNQIVAVDVILNLPPLITEDGIRVARHRTPHEVGEEAVQLRPRMVGLCKTPSPEAGGLHAKVSAILLN